MFIPYMYTVGFAESLNHEDFHAAPRALVVSVVHKTNHGVALCEIHGKCSNARLLMVLINAGKILMRIMSIAIEFRKAGVTYKPYAQLFSIDGGMPFEEELNRSEHPLVLRVMDVIG
jgi:hypothetical protein